MTVNTSVGCMGHSSQSYEDKDYRSFWLKQPDVILLKSSKYNYTVTDYSSASKLVLPLEERIYQWPGSQILSDYTYSRQLGEVG